VSGRIVRTNWRAVRDFIDHRGPLLCAANHTGAPPHLTTRPPLQPDIPNKPKLLLHPKAIQKTPLPALTATHSDTQAPTAAHTSCPHSGYHSTPTANNPQGTRLHLQPASPTITRSHQPHYDTTSNGKQTHHQIHPLPPLRGHPGPATPTISKTMPCSTPPPYLLPSQPYHPHPQHHPHQLTPITPQGTSGHPPNIPQLSHPIIIVPQQVLNTNHNYLLLHLEEPSMFPFHHPDYKYKQQDMAHFPMWHDHSPTSFSITPPPNNGTTPPLSMLHFHHPECKYKQQDMDQFHKWHDHSPISFSITPPPNNGTTHPLPRSPFSPPRLQIQAASKANSTTTLHFKQWILVI